MVYTSAFPISVDDVHQAAARIKKVVRRTPILYADFLSEQLGCNVYLKLENLQKTGAFKLRGAYNKIASLTDEERERGLIASSSGNHAQGVAYAAHAFGIDHCTKIYMPESTPQTKIDHTRRNGQVEIVFVDGTHDDASTLAHEDAYSSGATFIEPYNDWQIIAGQGTIGLEIMQDLPQTDAIIAPVGGGGLLGGIALAAKSIMPDVQLYGVQCHYEKASGITIADGIRVKTPGEKPTTLLETYVSGWAQVDEAAIVQAVRDVMKQTHLVVEGSGVVGIAALQTGTLRFPHGTNIVIVLSGGNIDLAQWRNTLI